MKNALSFLSSVLSSAVNPIVACSFGKDSMVCLDLARQIRPDIPVLFLRERNIPRAKLFFAEDVIRKWNLTVHTLEFCHTDLVSTPEATEIVRLYPLGANQFGQNSALYLPIGCDKSFSRSNYKCGLDVIREQPRAQQDQPYPWDITIMGHRSADVDPIHGPIPLRETIVECGATHMVYPIADWTDKQVWDYTLLQGLPVNEKRYDLEMRTEKMDRRFNNDYLDICTRCFEAGASSRVHCPKIDREIDAWPLLDYEKNNQKYRNSFAAVDTSGTL